MKLAGTFQKKSVMLTSKILDERGFSSKMLIVKGNIFATYKTAAGFKGVSYLEHFANIVEVKENGKTTNYVIDPMFTEKPIPLTDYLALLSIPGSFNHYEIKHQSYADKLTPPLTDEACQYNIKLLEDYEAALKDSLKNALPPQTSDKIYESRAEAKEAYLKTTAEFIKVMSDQKGNAQ